MDLMLDMSTEEFLLGLRRFKARWGKPKQLISDNASQFKLSSSVLEKMWKSTVCDPDVQRNVSNEDIKWQFIFELAPWMGGTYERLIGVVKRGLRKTIGKLCLTSEQLRTILAESEAVVNTRPLVYIGDDINSNMILTPAYFLMLNPKTGPPGTEKSFIEDPEYLTNISSADMLLQRLKKGQRHLNTFWKSRRDDYLLSLRERTAYKLKEGRIQHRMEPQVGDVVLIKDDLPRGSWKVGRLCELTVSEDGEIRSEKVLPLTKRTLNRPLNLLYPTECSDRTESGNSEQTAENQRTESTGTKNPLDNSTKERSVTSTDGSIQDGRSKRKAAEKAIVKIRDWLDT
uniref:Uncharacterized protein LOC111105185 n=1 Tax=Crassostrea virginica TaxID=6565 RepID=A0A8B8AUS3_CRAVI|nr:uncharacterized protein LOC111105185 [Crassostrea virginica]